MVVGLVGIDFVDFFVFGVVFVGVEVVDDVLMVVGVDVLFGFDVHCLVGDWFVVGVEDDYLNLVCIGG